MEILKNNILELHKKEFFEALFSKNVYIVEGVNDELFLKNCYINMENNMSSIVYFTVMENLIIYHL